MKFKKIILEQNKILLKVFLKNMNTFLCYNNKEGEM